MAVVLVLLKRLNRMAPAFVVTASSLVVYVTMVLVAAGLGWPVRFWPVSATYWFLALCFLTAFGAIYKSISLRILLDLLNRPNRSERFEAILDRYVQRESYQARLSILVADGLATQETAGFQLTPKGRRIAALVRALQTLFRIERSG